MRYQVVAHYYDDQEIVDQVIVDSFEEAAEIAVNWQDYYDADEDDKEVVVAVYEVDERSIVDG